MILTAVKVFVVSVALSLMAIRMHSLVTTTCQLHMRSFKDGDTITIEPWRSTAFPVLKDLVVHRSALDRIVQAGGYISVNTGAAPDAHAVPVPTTMLIVPSRQLHVSVVALV